MIAGNDNFDPFDYVGSGALKKREDGEPWVSWVRHGDTWGWLAPGALAHGGHPGDTVSRMLDVFLARESTALDRVHCCGDGILVVGPLGATFASGTAQKALWRCRLDEPETHERIMLPIRHATGVALLGTVLWNEDTEKKLTTAHALNQAIRLGSDSVKWKAKNRGQAQKDRSHLWVTTCAKLLREPALRPTLASAWIEILADAFPGWPGAHQMWQHPRRHQAAWAALLTLGYRYPAETRDLTRLALAAPDKELCSLRARLKLPLPVKGSETPFWSAVREVEELATEMIL